MDSQSLLLMRTIFETRNLKHNKYWFLENKQDLCGPWNTLGQIRCLTCLFSIGPMEWKGAKPKKGWFGSPEHPPPQWKTSQRCTSQYQHDPNGGWSHISIQVVTEGSPADGKLKSASNNTEKCRQYQKWSFNLYLHWIS